MYRNESDTTGLPDFSTFDRLTKNGDNMYVPNRNESDTTGLPDFSTFDGDNMYVANGHNNYQIAFENHLASKYIKLPFKNQMATAIFHS
jgi:hypothetical protein